MGMKTNFVYNNIYLKIASDLFGQLRSPILLFGIERLSLHKFKFILEIHITTRISQSILSLFHSNFIHSMYGEGVD